MNRRGFLGSLFGGIAAAIAVPFLPKPKSPLGFNRDAFKTAMAPLDAPLCQGEALNIGDVFTIEGRYALNPLTGLSTGCLQKFVATAPVAADDPFVPFWPTRDQPFSSPIDRRKFPLKEFKYGHTVSVTVLEGIGVA